MTFTRDVKKQMKKWRGDSPFYIADYDADSEEDFVRGKFYLCKEIFRGAPYDAFGHHHASRELYYNDFDGCGEVYKFRPCISNFFSGKSI